ncbi:carbohydrate ABC transporter permease [Nocardia sp. KC 131]|uniref:carbohydrate ABC transporter permease n=1 Tax=Nocardia arseniciresistens TaxID=3392119 RepID=UPI00398EA4C4
MSTLRDRLSSGTWLQQTSSTAIHRVPPGKRGRSAQRRERAGWVFVAPNLAAVAVLLLFPLGFSLYLSFHAWDLFSPPRFVGLANYRRLFVGDPLFFIALRNTAVFTALTLVPTVLIGLGVAATLNRKLAGIGIFRTIAFLPLVASTVAMAVVWRFIFSSDDGLFNIVLGWVGIDPVPWLIDPDLALVSLSIVTVWKGVPFATVILLAAMQGVPETLYEAAKIDGAGALRRFRSITMPLIRGPLSFVFVITIINSVQAFDQAYALTGGNGGPETGTYLLGIMLFQNAFSFYEVGYAAALAWVIFAILLVVTLLQLRFARREEVEL